MFTDAAMLFFYCETPLHAGSGSNISHVDLPLQRERHTDYPIVQASGVKGACRDWAENLLAARQGEITRIFGPEGDSSSEHSGAVAFTDAQVLLFPVRSFKGGFAWLTCPQVLNRLQRRLAMIGANVDVGWQAPSDTPAIGQVWTGKTCRLAADGVIILEDMACRADQSQAVLVDNLAAWLAAKAFPQTPVYAYLRQSLPECLLILHNDQFQDFVRLSTEIITRIRIGESGTVESGALWTQELLLADTLLYSLVLAKNLRVNGTTQKAQDSLQFIQELVTTGRILQMGGDETIGRGLVRPQFWWPAAAGGKS